MLCDVLYQFYEAERAENLEIAIASYQAALEILTPSSFPLECLKTGRNLGDLGFEIENWEIAIFGYNQAILAVEQSRNWAVSELIKREIIENALLIYQRMVQVCINYQDYPQALLTVERSKSQTLIELLNTTNLYPKNATDEQKQGIRKLRSQIASYQQQLMGSRKQELIGGALTKETGENFSDTPETNIRTQLQTANEQFQQLLAEIGDPDFNLTQQITPELPDLNHLLDSKTAILEWYLPANDESNFYLFLITPSPDKNFQIQPLTFPPEDYQKLKQAIRDYRNDYKKPIRERQLEKHLPIFSQTLQLSELLCQLTNYQRLILIPHRELHLIPLHALPISDSESQFLEDKFLIQYSPSCQILDNLHRRQLPKPDICHFFAIQNPTEDLTYTDLQIEVLRRKFNSQQIIPHIQATKATLNKPENQDFLRQATHIHLTGHGEFDEESPGKSYIRLANKEKLTFFDIFENLNIPNCRLLILSPCKTGLVETPPTDDYVGLASAFFYAGSQTVIASLWETYDFPTALLMIRLYQELPKFGSVVEALREAQYWLRNISRQEVLVWLSELNLSENQMKDCGKELRLYNKENPFVAPKYWAAFTVNGL
ncbi:MAG: CHAT domain-containing protein [Cyanobacteriota bacterium]|nr:CHAT domain-containing protein [Cyanobacteriota bacterium]